jgi:hypothetical protein
VVVLPSDEGFVPLLKRKEDDELLRREANDPLARPVPLLRRVELVPLPGLPSSPGSQSISEGPSVTSLDAFEFLWPFSE